MVLNQHLGVKFSNIVYFLYTVSIYSIDIKGN